MRDLWIHDNDLIVATHGRSFWILDDITPLRQIRETVAQSDAYLFEPAPAYRVRRDTNTDTPLPPDEPTARNPPDGALIDYWLAQASSGPVTLEIRDANGRLVCRSSSADPPEVIEEELKKSAPVPLYWIRRPKRLSGAAGMHRWVWDLREPPPKSEDHEYPISAIPGDTPRSPLGPNVLPGRYTVRLTVGGRDYTAPITVKMDPRVKTPRAGLQEEFRVETRLVSLMNSSYVPLAQSRSVSADCEKLSKQVSSLLAEQLGEFQKKISAVLGASGGFFAPVAPESTLSRVTGEMTVLYDAVSGVDSAPTTPQGRALARIEQDFSDVIRRWEVLRTVDLPAINRRLRASNLPELRLEQGALGRTESQNEE